LIGVETVRELKKNPDERPSAKGKKKKFYLLKKIRRKKKKIDIVVGDARRTKNSPTERGAGERKGQRGLGGSQVSQKGETPGEGGSTERKSRRKGSLVHLKEKRGSRKKLQAGWSP